MDSLPKDPILVFPPDTLQVVRKEFDLDKPGAIDRAIDILELWLKKQDHFTKKDFSRGYLERSIIRAKGSVERSKERLDKICTARVLMPDLYVFRNVREFVELDEQTTDALLPKLTKDYYRVFILQNYAQTFTRELFTEFYIRGFYYLEYISAFDYANGAVIVFDYRNLNLFEFIKYLDLVQTAQLLNLALNGYGIRVKEIHLISTSRFVNLLVSTFKQMISEKLANRIHVHAEADALLKYIDKDILPVEYGGTEVSMKEIHKKWVHVLSSEDFMGLMKETYKAKINEALRPVKKLNDEYLGMAGTFRGLSVD
ncbi:hypothetical protein evm_007797 [Chilo suppressalis]|nr:hypothetical protein evm_007797 [Chilo suppressalis]